MVDGFFHVYGIQTHELERDMVEHIGHIEKQMALFSIDAEKSKVLEKFTKID
jgi:hypothetical protein